MKIEMHLGVCLIIAALLIVGSEAGPRPKGGRFPNKRRPANCDEQCPPECHRVSNARGCFKKCDCTTTDCPTPSCEEGCTVEENVHGPCPGCVCGDEKKPLPPSPFPPTEHDDDDKDKVPCDPPKCNPGCHLEMKSDGPCPECVCDDLDIDIPAEKVICDSLRCGEPGCRLQPGDPCPICVCDDDAKIFNPRVKCAPLNCDPGCRIEKAPKDQCPHCECPGKDDDAKKVQCAPLKCDHGCIKEKFPDDDCPHCECPGKDDDFKDEEEKKVVCSPPECPPGCRIETDFDGPCPGCNCSPKNKDTKPLIQCTPPKCEEGCKPEREPGLPCPICKCKDNVGKDEVVEGKKVACGPPNCPQGCTVQKVLDGPCPGCECDENKDGWTILEEDKNVACAPPKCPPGCNVLKVFDGPCPGCECDEKKGVDVPFNDCELQACPPGCPLEEVPGMPCPQCVCKKEIDGLDCENAQPVAHGHMEILSDGSPASQIDSATFRPGTQLIYRCNEGYHLKGPEVLVCEPSGFWSEQQAPECLPVQQCPPEPPCRPPQCQLEEDSDSGCRVCKCLKPKCSPPKCKRFCKIQPGQSGCPECVCPGDWRQKW